MWSIGVASSLLLALSAGASADIIAPASSLSQMDDSVSWAVLQTDGSASSTNGVTVTTGWTSSTTDFATPVSGVAFLASLADSGTFTISAFGAGDTLLGTESVAAGTNSNPFVGLMDDAGADIYSVGANFSDTSNPDGSGNFTIDSLLLSDTQAATGSGLITSNAGPRPTPEPSALILCGSALIGFGYLRRRRAS